MVEKSIFREYDIRGIFDKELNYNSVSKIGYYLGLKIKKIGDYVGVGYDARTHSPELFGYLVSGLNKAGLKVIDFGLVPTPTNYFGNFNKLGDRELSASIQITGSHNPPEYNGFKITVDKKPFFGSDIYALRDEIVTSSIEIEENTSVQKYDVLNDYIDYMVKEFEALRGMDNIVIDCGNGAGGVAIEPILKRLGIKHKALFVEPDGTFPNHHPDPSEEETLKDIKKELEGNYTVGFAYDGDADRVAVLTKKYNIKGDILALLFAKQMQNPTIIGEVKCSQIMYDEINRLGKAVMWKTGHSNLKVKIKELNADLAAEVSGHMFFNDRYFGFDDALYATLRVLELIKNGLDLDAEIDKLPLMYSTEEIKVKTTEDKKFKIVQKIAELLENPPADFPKIREIIRVDGVRIVFEQGWGLVRASNTTPILVTRFESSSAELAKAYETKINALIQEAEKQL